MQATKFIEALSDVGVRFYTGVPDSYLYEFCAELQTYCNHNSNVVAANEGNAIGIAVGHYLATGEVPLVYMQNSGLGNAINPLVSLACREMLGIPIILLIGWRGDPWHLDHVQHKLQGEITPSLLSDIGIPYIVLNDEQSETFYAVTQMVSKARDENMPVAILVPKDIFSGLKSSIIGKKLLLSREEAIEVVLDSAPADSLYSATTGRAARELYYLREARGENHSCDYLNVGSMGHASSIALGIALAVPDRQVICLDGDAAAIMHMGAFTMPSRYEAPNFLHIVLNNGMHESVGGRPSAGQDIDLTTIAAACGYETVGGPVFCTDDISWAAEELCKKNNAAFLDVYIRPGIRSDIPGLEINPTDMKSCLMRELRSD
ncbi:phosphonopyruvate decarboxylase [Adlercreutzia sp. ZJ304]|uniref:phosphonopyruvate decarboxylase n=1 Tax=Adlercreutzia sp. ZJ304 TaxID=2709791 RepID=UPI0013EB3A47|nr:phosphonopyruvate decarboxylase [Adlercreutzia sp. ZJ304]